MTILENQSNSLVDKTFKLPAVLEKKQLALAEDILNKMTLDTKGTKSNPCACD